MSRRVRALISLVQQGVISQNEFAKYGMMGSGGLIEYAAPLTDEERRDWELHIHGLYGSALAIQVKSVLQLYPLSKNALYLRSFFVVRASRLVNDPLFYYFYAYLDPKVMRFADPTFLIPSSVFHEQANPEKKGGFWHFTFEASMEPGSHDKWVPYRVNALDLGQKLLEIMRSHAGLDLPPPRNNLPPPFTGEGRVGASRLVQNKDLIWVRKGGDA